MVPKKIFWYSGPQKNYLYSGLPKQSSDTVVSKKSFISGPQKKSLDTVVPKKIFWNSGPQKKFSFSGPQKHLLIVVPKFFLHILKVSNLVFRF